MSRIKDLLLRLQNEQDQPNPNEIKLSFNDQWFLLTTMLGFIKHSKYSTNRKMRLIKLFDIFFLASTKGSSIKFSKIIANTKK
jgi:hypothetical protein|tara:strand:+ start:93 stop:341 length:249 start_codon:yes stop_codon:yes gene_type:complete